MPPSAPSELFWANPRRPGTLAGGYRRTRPEAAPRSARRFHLAVTRQESPGARSSVRELLTPQIVFSPPLRSSQVCSAEDTPAEQKVAPPDSSAKIPRRLPYRKSARGPTRDE